MKIPSLIKYLSEVRAHVVVNNSEDEAQVSVLYSSLLAESML